MSAARGFTPSVSRTTWVAVASAVRESVGRAGHLPASARWQSPPRALARPAGETSTPNVRSTNSTPLPTFDEPTDAVAVSTAETQLRSVVWVGTSGFVYPHWRRIFYPEDLPARAWLEHYAKVFRTCELNATFYRLPAPGVVDGWRDRTPRGFLFACKGSRYLTHLKRLKEPAEGLTRYFDVLGRLGPKLGPVLWQLPPGMKPDLARLEDFLAQLPEGVRHAIELRSEGWYTDEVAGLLDRRGAAFCEHDLVARRPPRLTGGWRYLRFHGTSGKYAGRYGRRALRPVAEDLGRFPGDAYAYFNNDTCGAAVVDALDLLELLGEGVARPPAPLGTRS